MSYIPWTAPVSLLLRRLSLVSLPWWKIAALFLLMAVGIVLSFWAGVEVWLILRQPA